MRNLMVVILVVFLVGCDVPQEQISTSVTTTPMPMSNTRTIYVSDRCIIRHVKVDNYPSFYLAESKGGGIKCAVSTTPSN